ncbi:MAG: HEAT repeat domain-containing protein, partial [Phycisphaerae bacterium]|nr:HEAT repeat domain-containing protein [Phycisphaerae bacterium]
MTGHAKQWFAVFAGFVVLAATAPALGQRGLKNIPDPDPVKQQASFKVAEGFEVNLFAADPMIANPIQMNWDERGRLWVATSPIYPHIVPGAKADDKVIVLEDTDGDGRADRRTVFAEGLLIPTSVLPGDGGAYVANSTQLLHLADTDGDGKADRRRIVLDGFGTEDTHHILHALRWGPEGYMYFNQSIYIHSYVETPWGVRHLLGGGIWRFRPDSLKLNVFARGFVNSWGHRLDRWGQSFATDGAYGHGINYVFPGAAFVAAKGVRRVLPGLNPGQPKHCSMEILSGRHLPDDWAGSIVTNDFRGNRVNRFVLSDSGSGYVSRQAADLLSTRHMAFRPVDVKMGPDGAIYICDWYNPIIQHGEVDFRDPRRDHVHGRIWRITATGRPLVTPPKLAGASVAELLAALKLPEAWSRDQATRLLKERGAAAVEAELGRWTKGLDPADADDGHHRLQALWAYQAIDVVNEKLLRQLLAADDFRLRAAAVRTLESWQARISGFKDLLAAAVDDDHPRVRLEAVNALRSLGGAEAAVLALRAVDRGELDQNLDYAVWLTARELQAAWLPPFQAGQLKFGSVKQVSFALKAIENPAALRPLVAMLGQGKIPAGDRLEVINLIGAMGASGDLGVLFDLAVSKDASATDRRALLAALEQAAARRRVRPGRKLEPIAGLLGDSDARTRRLAAQLAGHWKMQTLRPKLLEMAEGADPASRAAGIDGLARLGTKADTQALSKMTAAGRPIGLRLAAATGLGSIDLGAGARQAAAVLKDLPVGADPTDLFAMFLGNKGGPAALAKSLAGARLPSHAAAAGVRQATTSGRKDVKGLIAALTKAGGLTPMSQKLTAEQLNKLLQDVAASGDPGRGETVYRRVELACQTCHAIGGAGGRGGADMLSIGASAPVDYIVEALLEPSKKIKEGYHMTVVETHDGKVVSGTLVSQDKRELILRDAADKPVTIAAGNVKKQSIVPVSLMPPGLTAKLRRDQFVDLVSFLSVLGKPGPYRVSPARL